MTLAEKRQFLAWFPRMNVGQAAVTGEATNLYNCIAWSVGVTDQWINLRAVFASYDAFYRYLGFLPGNGPVTVATWGINGPNGLAMQHACIAGPEHGPRWESKFGSALRAQHYIGELEPGIYGNVVQYYWRATPPETRELIEAANRTRPSVVTDDHAAAVRAESAKLSAALREQFEEAFAAWKRTWSLPHIAISSNADSVCHSAEFLHLLALGPDIIPAVVEKLIEPDNFFALQLYDRLQPRRQLTVLIDPASHEILEGEQGRARRTVQRFAASL
jgi:hypothetical protein